MSFRLDRVHLWSCEVPDEAGGVARKLSALAESGANLEYVGTRRVADKPGTGILYVSGITGAEPVKAAKAAGLHEVQAPVVVRVEGDNAAGLAHRVTHQWAKAGISFQGMTMCMLAGKFVGYAAFDTAEDANTAARILAEQGANGAAPVSK